MAHHDVFGLDVSMDDACLMRCRESVCNLDGDVECLAYLYRRALEMLAQSLAFNEFGGDEMSRICVPDLVNGQDVWMVQT